MLLLSTSFGFFVRKVRSTQQKKLICTILGFSVLLILSGSYILHPILLTVINAAIVLCANKRFCHVISFLFCFSYLLFLRTSEYFGIPSPPEITCTAVMIMVLKLASSAEIWELPFLYRVFYVWPWFFSFRMRIYVAFVLGECICINLGLGAYPEKSATQPGAGPTNLIALKEIYY
ncbi:Lysophospholipid acyltransferase 7 like protein [Argiope bruennichi]|uniref:Lysophospholipid acyltransferase 7 like protein n=1 Tax=Argiope bruennichi TaxID=94029 RepID=A0A8T0E559_ARGBR|nr:Lysophospholipid acyltransferase 7 like protein [Argiope bruennichi]